MLFSGYIPLEELYKLNQIIQDASQREQCLETKLIALQHIVDEARRSAEESWQVCINIIFSFYYCHNHICTFTNYILVFKAYVGEERLLSRVAALENQLTQVGKNWGEDRFREELQKLHVNYFSYLALTLETMLLCFSQEDRNTYQIAAKESVQKLLVERLEAVATAGEHQRARATAEQDAMLAREEVEKAQNEIQVNNIHKGYAVISNRKLPHELRS